MNKISQNIFSVFLATFAFLIGPDPCFAQRMEPIDRPWDAHDPKPSKKEQEDARRAIEMMKRTIERRKEQIRAANEAELKALQEKINSDANALRSEFETKLNQLDEEWMKKFEVLKSDVLSQDVKERIQAEIEAYILDLILQKRSEIAPASELKDLGERSRVVSLLWEQLRKEITPLQSVTPSTAPRIDLGLKLILVPSGGQPLSQAQRLGFEADARAAVQKQIAAELFQKSEQLQLKWMNQLETLMQNDSDILKMIEHLKRHADEVFDKEMESSL
jgi:hypothetical protein